ncbi:MAG TPA: chemotaxis protein CheW [Polyangiaceae bacterium]|nr:chemotaxis protein CheW [Polyangiaceae bacterium]
MSADRERARAALRMRDEFDRSFAQAPELAKPSAVDLLQIRVGERRYAVRLADVAAVHAERRVVAVPTPDSKLLGLVGLRGSIAPVFDLALALGHERATGPRWLLELRAAKPCALAFSELEGHLRLPAEQLTAGAGEGGRFAGNAATEAGPLPVIDLSAVYAEVTGQGTQTSTRNNEGRT